MQIEVVALIGAACELKPIDVSFMCEYETQCVASVSRLYFALTSGINSVIFRDCTRQMIHFGAVGCAASNACTKLTTGIAFEATCFLERRTNFL